MPRYEDRYGGSSTRLYVGGLSSRTRTRDLEYVFSKYGRVRDVDMKRDYAFVDFSDARDADDAQYYLDGKDLDGRRITVEFAKGVPRGPGGYREYVGRGPAPGSGRCFNCGIEGHWARDCKSGDWKNTCYRCGERGHIEKNCQNSPKKLSRGRSYSRSPVRSRSPRRGRGRGVSRSRSYSPSRSPPPRRGRDTDRKERRSRSPRGEKKKYRSPTPDRDDSPRDRSSSPKRSKMEIEENQNGDSPKARSRSLSRSRSPISPAGDRKYEESPYGRNGHNNRRSSRSPRDEIEKSPVADDDNVRSPGGASASP